jgi:hypothetical protein
MKYIKKLLHYFFYFILGTILKVSLLEQPFALCKEHPSMSVMKYMKYINNILRSKE